MLPRENSDFQNLRNAIASHTNDVRKSWPPVWLRQTTPLSVRAMYGKIELPSTSDRCFHDNMANLVQNSNWKYSQLYNLAELKGWFTPKGLSNRGLNMMFYTFPYIACSYMKIQHFFFMRNCGYSYSPKRFVVQHNRANILAFHARIASENQTKKRSSDRRFLRSPCLDAVTRREVNYDSEIATVNIYLFYSSIEPGYLWLSM